MATARSDFRARIGRALGRRYYVTSTTTGTSTTKELVDSTRTEARNEFDGAAILISSQKTLVRVTEPNTGRIFLDTALSGAPASGTSYEMVKGFNFEDFDDAIDYAHAEAYPHFYLPVDDTATLELASTTIYALAEAWRKIDRILREDKGSSPVTYSPLTPGRNFDYELRAGAAGLTLELFYTPEANRKLRIVGKGILTIAAADASSSIVPWQVIVPGALAYLYDKGINSDEAQLSKAFADEAEKQYAHFERAKRKYAQFRETRRARSPRSNIVNDGSTVAGGW